MKIKTYPLSDFRKKVYKATQKIPKGKVVAYGWIARRIGQPKASRAVGQALNKNPFAPKVPCHRVINANGLVGGFASGQFQKIKILRKEGIAIRDNKITDRSQLIG